jgi:hypothetical protein
MSLIGGKFSLIRCLNIHKIHNVRQKDIQRVEPLMLEPRLVGAKVAIGKLKGYKLPDTD